MKRLRRIWAELRERKLDFLEIVQNIKKSCLNGDTKVTRLIKSLQVPITDSEHILIRSARERRSFLVENGRADVPVARELIELSAMKILLLLCLFFHQANTLGSS